MESSSISEIILVGLARLPFVISKGADMTLRLVTAAKAANKANQKSFFKAHMVRAIYQLGDSQWKRAKGARTF